MSPSRPDWVWRDLAGLCDVPKKVDPATIGRDLVKYIDIGALSGPSTHLPDVAPISATTAPSRCRQVLRDGDTIFSTVRPYMEKIGLVDTSLHEEFASTAFCVLRPGPELDPKFLHYFARSSQMLDQVLPLQRGVSYPAVLDKQVRAALAPVPPLSEQRRIVEILEDHLSRLDWSAHALARGKLSLTPLEESWLARSFPVDHSEGFEELGRVVAQCRGGWSRSARHLVEDGSGRPYLKMHNITRRGRLDLSSLVYVHADEGEVEKFGVKAGDVLFNSKNSGDLVGKTTVATQVVDGALLNENIMRIRLVDDVCPDFVAIAFLAPDFRRQVLKAASASTNVAAVYQRDLLRFRLRVPSLAEQQSLAGEFEALRESARSFERSIASAESRIRALRRALLAAAFSGQLTGRDSDLERAEELVEA